MQCLERERNECSWSMFWGKEGETGGGRLLLWWVVCEADALCNVTLQAFHTGLEKGLFVLVEVGEWVIGLLCSGSLSIVSEHGDLWGSEMYA